MQRIASSRKNQWKRRKGSQMGKNIAQKVYLIVIDRAKIPGGEAGVEGERDSDRLVKSRDLRIGLRWCE